ncbi:hypothetical protein TWF506_010001 [Arthrobotrys conoides]|uniref:N-acetyltransferase domain-containing protein n=1 Tax=Arthrobotrys conoides TaxID=74498 RepID=A0AAN8RLR0_9PEZI
MNIPSLPFPTLPTKNGYKYTIRQATTSDIPSLTVIHFTAFGDEIDQIIPNNIDGQAWMSEAFRVCFEEFGNDCLTVVVIAGEVGGYGGGDGDDGLEGGGEIVAYARYILPTREVWNNMYSYPKAVGGMEQDRIDKFLGGLEEQHSQVMGWEGGRVGVKHLWFENLATHPSHRKLGIGRALVGYLCTLADEMGLEVYLDASDFGMGLYEKFGFETVEGVGNRAVSVPMVRRVKG